MRGIGAGFLVAAMVWMTPAAEGSEFALIALTAWLIALGGFTHVIAGMVEIAALVFAGELSAGDGLVTLALPTLAGNVPGRHGALRGAGLRASPPGGPPRPVSGLGAWATASARSLPRGRTHPG